MKNILILFWKNMVANKYWIGILVFLFFIVECTREWICRTFGASLGWFIFIEAFSACGILAIIIGDWLTRDSQK